VVNPNQVNIRQASWMSVKARQSDEISIVSDIKRNIGNENRPEEGGFFISKLLKSL
jgi:hypothetical protein